MGIYLSAQRLARTLNFLGHSRAKRTPLFDFLIVKRTLAIKGEPSVAITETEQAFIQALEEIAGCGKVDGIDVRPGHPYLNFFALREKDKSGYRPAKYRSNGTNTNIAGTQWPPVITVAGEKPRKASLAEGYIVHLPNLVLSTNTKDPLPNLTEAGIWFHRGQDIEPVIAGTESNTEKLQRITDNFVVRSV